MKAVITLLLFFIASCEFSYSPYMANAPKLNHNANVLSLIESSQVEISEEKEYRIAILADTHNYYDKLRLAIKKINDNGPYDFVVVVGDITNNGLLDEYKFSKEMFDKLHYPYFVIIGNHDYLANGRRIFNRMFGETNFSFTHKNTQFVFFDNNNWEGPNQIKDIPWVVNELEKSDAQRRVLMAHIPLDDHNRFSAEEIKDWVDLVLEEYNINYVINGHNHSPAETTLGRTIKITAGSPVHNSFYELIFTPTGEVSHQKISF